MAGGTRWSRCRSAQGTRYRVSPLSLNGARKGTPNRVSPRFANPNIRRRAGLLRHGGNTGTTRPARALSGARWGRRGVCEWPGAPCGTDGSAPSATGRHCRGGLASCHSATRLKLPRQWWNQPRPGAALLWCGTCGNGSGDTTSGLPLPVPWLAIAWGFTPPVSSRPAPTALHPAPGDGRKGQGVGKPRPPWSRCHL
jgi:hypothetical protein